MASQTDFFVELDGAVDGPMSGIEVRELALQGKLTPQTRVALSRGESKLRWVPAQKVNGLFDGSGRVLPHPPITQAYLDRLPADPASADPVSADAVSADAVSADAVSADAVSADVVSADATPVESVVTGVAELAGGEAASPDNDRESLWVDTAVAAPASDLAPPGVADPPPVNPHAEFQWHYSYQGQPCGPVSHSQLLDLVRERKIDQQTLVWREGFNDWTMAAEVEGLIPT